MSAKRRIKCPSFFCRSKNKKLLRQDKTYHCCCKIQLLNTWFRDVATHSLSPEAVRQAPNAHLWVQHLRNTSRKEVSQAYEYAESHDDHAANSAAMQHVLRTSFWYEVVLRILASRITWRKLMCGGRWQVNYSVTDRSIVTAFYETAFGVEI